MDAVGLVLRWIHILSAIALVGGLLFQRLALIPSLVPLSTENQASLTEAVRGRWSKIVMMTALLLIVSGLINFILTIGQFKPPNPELPKYYHMVFGIKFLLALAIFFLASVLAGRSEGTRRFREQAPRWLSINLVLAIILVCLSGVLRSAHTGPNLAPPDTSMNTNSE